MCIFAGIKKIRSKDIWLLVAQVLLLSLIMLSPALISFISSGGDGKLVVDSMWIAFYWLTPAMCVYIGEEIIHIPDGYLQTFRTFLETRSFNK